MTQPTRERYEAFLVEYARASRTNPILGFKDGLFNILRQRARRPLFRGCTGFGCGAAFNFVAVLPDGQVDACRKFSSRIGHLGVASFEEIYASDAARRYRAGCRRCRGCRLRNVCGGCLAVTQGEGRDPFHDADPHCFVARPESA